jgi:type III secretory pathway lipoprotein EscJ
MLELIWKKVIFLVVIVLLSGCATTALYGNKFQSVGNDIYTLKIYFGAPATYSQSEIEHSTDARLKAEAEKFIKNNDAYFDFQIVRSQSDMTNRHYIYTIQFLRK